MASIEEAKHIKNIRRSSKNNTGEEEMTPQEADKICAEFMNEKISECGTHILDGRVSTRVDPSAYYMKLLYSKSLDALVPVWEKLNPYRITYKKSIDGWACTIFIQGKLDATAFWHKTIQAAAAIATAKALKELKK